MELKIERRSRTYSNAVHTPRDVSLTIAPGMFGLLGAHAITRITELT